MKLFCFVVLLFLSSNYVIANHPNYLKKNRVLTQAEFFLFDGETYQQEPPSSNNYIGNCYVVYNSTIYDLNPISKKPIQVPSINRQPGQSNSIYLDLCKNIVITGCPSNNQGMLESLPINQASSQSQAQSQTCKLFAGSYRNDKHWVWESPLKYTVSLPEGDRCLNNVNYKTSITLKCNSQAQEPRVLNPFDESKCDNTLVIESASGKLLF
jgi:hypothetical protein